MLSSLRLLIDVIEETCGLDKMKDNFVPLTLALDMMFDYGMPQLAEKSFLVQVLSKTDSMLQSA